MLPNCVHKMPSSRALSRRSALRGAAAALLAVWLLRELQWLRRWRAYWRALQHQMRAPALTTSVSVALDLSKLGLLSDDSFVSVVSGLLLGTAPRRSPSFAAQLHKGLSYLADRRHPSRTDLADTQPHIARAQSAASVTTAAAGGATDEPSVFARGPAVLPLPWSVCAAAQRLRPLASAAALPRGDGWRASLEADGVSVLWREPQGRLDPEGAGAGGEAPLGRTYRRGDNQRTETPTWLLLHGIGGADRRCADGLLTTLTPKPAPSPRPYPNPKPVAGASTTLCARTSPRCLSPLVLRYISPQVHRRPGARVPRPRRLPSRAAHPP